jgi:hypothetical protein
MGHCGGGEATLDNFDMLTAIMDWVEKGEAPAQVMPAAGHSRCVTARCAPGRSMPHTAAAATPSPARACVP